jgi:hypothetical protein
MIMRVKTGFQYDADVTEGLQPVSPDVYRDRAEGLTRSCAPQQK